MPLEKGNTWNYKSVHGDMTSYFKFEVLNEITINGKKYVILDSNTVARNDNNGLLLAGYNYEGQGKIYDDIFFKYPIKFGETFSYTPLDKDEEPYKFKVSSGSIHVQAGQFNCYVYKFIDNNGKEVFPFFYFTPGIGLIKIEFEADEKEKIELISYKLE